MSSKWFTPRGSGGVEASAQAQQDTAAQQQLLLQQQQARAQNAWSQYLQSMGQSDSYAQQMVNAIVNRAGMVPATPTDYSSSIVMPTSPGAAPTYANKAYSSSIAQAPSYTKQNAASQVPFVSNEYLMPTSPGAAPSYASQNLAGGVGNAPSYASQNLGASVPFLGEWSGAYPTGLGKDYASQIISPTTNYANQIRTMPLSDWSAPTGSQYTLDSEVMKALSGGASAEDVQRQVQEAYGTLGGIDLSNYASGVQSSLESDLARRGITGASGALSKRIGLANWQAVENAKLGAQGTLAGIEAGESVRSARNQSMLSAEGLKQAAASSALGVGTTTEQVRANRAAEQLAAIQAAAGLQQGYVSGTNEATALAQQLASGALQLDRQGVLDVESLKQGRAAQQIAALQAQSQLGSTDLANQLSAYNAGLTGLQTQSALSSEELNRQIAAYNAALSGNLQYTQAYNTTVGQRADQTIQALLAQSQLGSTDLANEIAAYNTGIGGVQAQSQLDTDELQRQIAAYNTSLGGNIQYNQALNNAVLQQAGLGQQNYQNAVTQYGLRTANQQYKDSAQAAYLQYLQNQQNQMLGLSDLSGIASGYGNLGQTYAGIGSQYAQMGQQQWNMLSSLVPGLGYVFGNSGGGNGNG